MIAPGETTTYTLSATGTDGRTLKREVTVEVRSRVALRQASFHLPIDGKPNNNGFIGPFCCTGRTATVSTTDGRPVGYVYFFGWRGQAFSVGSTSFAPDLEILISGLTDLSDINSSMQKSSIVFPGSTMHPGASNSAKVGALNYSVTIEQVNTMELRGQIHFDMGTIAIRVDVSIVPP